MLLSRFNREMTQNQCFVQIGADRIEKILTHSQIETLRKEWSINLSNMNLADQDTEMENHQTRLPKKRLLKYLGNPEESETGKNRLFFVENTRKIRKIMKYVTSHNLSVSSYTLYR